uniref:Mannose-1-phosphate guanyltransferase beta n=1 Tax=Lygus hesperus TaxID=30085 RepID=A0A0A9WVN3_LYGHE
MAKDSQLCAFALEGFWQDIGQPRDFVDGIGMFLNALSASDRHNTDALYHEKKARSESQHFTIIGSVMIDPTAKVGHGCVIGPNVTIGANCHIAPSCRISNTAIFNNCTIDTGAYIDHSIIGWSSKVGR